MAELTLEDVRASFDYDPDSGVLTWIKKRTSPKTGTDVAGCKNNAGYLVTCIRSKLYLNHRLIWFYVFGEWPRQVIDHINGNRLDNSLVNLRDVSHAANVQNVKSARKHSSSGVPGVRRNGSGWMASITVDKKAIYLGTFRSIDDASAAFQAAKLKYHTGYVGSK